MAAVFSACRIQVERLRAQVLDREFRPTRGFDRGSRRFREMGPWRNCTFIAARALTRIAARIPSRPPDGGRNEKIVNVTLAEGALAHPARNHSRPSGTDGMEIYPLHLTDWRKPESHLLRLAVALSPHHVATPRICRPTNSSFERAHPKNQRVHRRDARHRCRREPIAAR
jgi:hypothetical protein